MFLPIRKAWRYVIKIVTRPLKALHRNWKHQCPRPFREWTLATFFRWILFERYVTSECCRIHFNNKTNRLLSPVQYLLAAKIRISERKSKFIWVFPSMSTAQRYKKHSGETHPPECLYKCYWSASHIDFKSSVSAFHYKYQTILFDFLFCQSRRKSPM